MRKILTALRCIWIILELPFVKTFHPQILGLPFVAFWIQAGVVITVFCIHTLWTLDKKDKKRNSQ